MDCFPNYYTNWLGYCNTFKACPQGMQSPRTLMSTASPQPPLCPPTKAKSQHCSGLCSNSGISYCTPVTQTSPTAALISPLTPLTLIWRVSGIFPLSIILLVLLSTKFCPFASLKARQEIPCLGYGWSSSQKPFPAFLFYPGLEHCY